MHMTGLNDVGCDSFLRERVTGLKSRLLTLMRAVRCSSPYYSVDTTSPKLVEVWESYFQGAAAKRVIIYLRSSGCSWAVGPRVRGGRRNFFAGCFDCEHSIAETTCGVRITPHDYVCQFDKAYSDQDFSNIPVLCLFNEGSLLNNSELPAEALSYMLNRISKNNNIHKVIVESLPVYITDDSLQALTNALPGKSVEIGIGLESSNILIRELCINKPFSLSDFRQAVSLCKKIGVKVLAYVLLKPNFLTEREAIEDAISSIRYAFSVGVDAVSVEPVSVGKYNMAGMLQQFGLYRQPWLWSIIEVLKHTHELGEIRVGGLQFAPKYKIAAENCKLCSKKMYKLIYDYNMTLDMHCFNEASCPCYKDWKKKLLTVELPLDKRIELYLSKILHV